MKTQVIVIVIAAVCILSGVIAWFVIPAPSANAPTGSSAITAEADVIIVRTAEGYEPKEVTIKRGDVVEFMNESEEFHWPASDLHPTHGVYPEFDPLRPIAVGESWKFQFDKAGVWKYHDHIRANKVGTITVE